MKKILIFSLAYNPIIGGAEIAIKEITDRIPDIEFDMITLRFSSSHLKREKIGNINVYRIGGGLGYLSKILFVPEAAALGIELCRKNKYDMLWPMMTYMLFPISFMRILGNRTPYVLTLQDGDPFSEVFNRARIRIFSPFLKYGFKHVNTVQAISNFLGAWAKEAGYKGRVEVIPNGVDSKKFSKIPDPIKLQDLTERLEKKEDEIYLITTSRLVEKNGVGDVVDSLKFLPETVKFLVLGVGPLEAKLKLKAKNLYLENRVVFLGHVPYDDIPLYLHISDIFIRPSLSEGFGNSFIEAMAAGLPVIATPVGGIVDFLFDPDKDHDMPATGLFVNVNDPKNIAVQVMRLIDNLMLRHTLIQNASKLVREKYEWDLVAKDMKERVFK